MSGVSSISLLGRKPHLAGLCRKNHSYFYDRIFRTEKGASRILRVNTPLLDEVKLRIKKRSSSESRDA